MTFFAKAVDRRSRQAMTEFLTQHYRYVTLNSWNRSTSYAHCIKIHRLGLSHDELNCAYETIGADYWDEIDSPISTFTEQMSGAYTIGTNGRSGGYLVLLESRYEYSEHKSRCRSCGQLNFKRVSRPLEGAEAVIGAKIIRNGGTWRDEVYLGESEILEIDLPAAAKLAMVRKLKVELEDTTLGNRCGRCHAEGERGRMNISPIRQLAMYAGRSIDHDEDFDEWSISRLRSRVELVAAFDRACDEIRSNFIDLLSNYVAVEKTVMVPQKVTVLEPRAI